MKPPPTNLRRLLAGLYPTEDHLRLALRDVGAAVEEFDTSGSPSEFWGRSVERLHQMDLLDELIAKASQDFPRRAPELALSAELYSRESNRQLAAESLQQPGLVRYVLDRFCCRLHLFLTDSGTFSRPKELPEFHDYLDRLESDILHEQKQKTYLPLAAKTAPAGPLNELQPDPFLSPVHQAILQLIGREEGGDSASAPIAAVNSHSRTIHNILSTLIRAEDPLVLLGEPGSGKTLTLQEAVKALIDEGRRRIFPSIPVYVRLGEFHVSGKPESADVLDFVKRSVPDSIASRIEGLAAAGRLILFFDGMDEMSRERYTEHTEALSRFAHRRKCLFSCRIADFSPAFLHQKLVLLPFDRRAIYDYLGKYIPTFPLAIDGQEYSRKSLAARIARRDLAVEADNPFVLWLLCQYVQQKYSWPSSRVELLGFYNRENYRRKSEELEDTPEALPPLEQCLEGWAWLAHKITSRNLGAVISLSDLDRPDGKQIVHAGKICSIFAESGDGQSIRFQHHRFQEYFTALHLSRNPGELKGAIDFDAPRWQETVVNLLLLSQSDDQVIRDLTASIAQFTGELQAEIDSRKGEIEAFEAQRSKLSKLMAKERERQDKLSNKREPKPVLLHIPPRLADRVEFASRILRQRVAGSAAHDELARQVSEIVPLLVEFGNPIVQVKMIRVCLNVPEIDWVKALDKPLHSEIAWVRNQALILIGSNRAAARAVGSDLASEIAHDLASSQFPHRVPAYMQAAKASGERRAWRPVAWGAAAFALHAILLLMLALLPFFGLRQGISLKFPESRMMNEIGQSPYWERPLFPAWVRKMWDKVETKNTKPLQNDPEQVRKDMAILRSPLSLAVCLIAILVAGVIAVVRRTPAWYAMAAASCAASALLPGLASLWSGSGRIIFFLWSAVCGVYILRGLGSVAAYAIHVLAVSGYVLASRFDRQTGHTLAEFVRPVWAAGDYGRFPREDWRNLRMYLGIGLCLVFGPWLAVHLTTLTGLPYHPILNLFLVVGPPLMILLGIRIWRRILNGKLDWELVGILAGVLLLGLVVFGLFMGITRLVEWLAEKPIWRDIARALVVVVIVALVIFLSRTTNSLWRMMGRYARWRYPAGRFTRETWTQTFQANDAVDQEQLLLRTNAKSVGLEPPEYLKLLEQVEPWLKGAPAQDTYWTQRDRLQEILRQERT